MIKLFFKVKTNKLVSTEEIAEIAESLGFESEIISGLHTSFYLCKENQRIIHIINLQRQTIIIASTQNGNKAYCAYLVNRFTYHLCNSLKLNASDCQNYSSFLEFSKKINMCKKETLEIIKNSAIFSEDKALRNLL